MIEREIRQLLKNEYRGWIDWIEPRGNAGVGRPDCDFLVDGQIVPVELKIGESVGQDTYKCKTIRPVQVSWHRRFNDAGGFSLWLFSIDPKSIDLAWSLKIVEGECYKFSKIRRIYAGEEGFTENFNRAIRELKK